MKYFCVLILNPEKVLDLNRDSRNQCCVNQSPPKGYVFIYSGLPNFAVHSYLNEMFAEKGFQIIDDGQIIPFKDEKVNAVGVIIHSEGEISTTEFHCADFNHALLRLLFRQVTIRYYSEFSLSEFVLDDYRLSMIEKLLAVNPDMPFRDSENRTLLQLAVQKGHRDLFDMLLKYGADVNKSKRDGTTLLHSAVERSRKHGLHFVQMLLDKGANVNSEKKRLGRRTTPLFSAIKPKNMELVRLLLERGAKVNCTTSYNGTTCLHVAVRLSHDSAVPIVKLLLQFDADMHVIDEFGFTPLYEATKTPQLLQLFFEKGVPVDFKISGQTLLLLAVEQKWFESAEFLLTLRPDPNLTENRNAFSLSLRTDTEKHGKLADIMHQQGFTISSAEKKFQKGLFLGAIRRGFVDVVQQFINDGFDIKPNCHDNYLTPAIKSKKLELIELFLEHGSDPNIATHEFTPMRYALMYNVPEAIDLLEKFGGVFRADQFIIYHKLPKGILDRFPYPTDISTREKGMVCRVIKKSGANLQMLRRMVTAEVVCPKFNVMDFVDASLYDASLLKLDVFKKECELEFKMMKEEIIDGSRVTYLDILTQENHQIARYTKNQSIVEAMEPSVINTRFPIYSSNLICRFQSGVKQMNLVDQAHSALKAILSKNCTNITDDIVALIIAYLNNRDLVILQKYFPLKQATQKSD